MPKGTVGQCRAGESVCIPTNSVEKIVGWSAAEGVASAGVATAKADIRAGNIEYELRNRQPETRIDCNCFMQMILPFSEEFRRTNGCTS